MNVISTFSGCGGSSLGYKMAGFKVLWANEFIPMAAEVYKLNHPDTILDQRDIREIQPQEILDVIGLKSGELDLLDGSPPCASFSTAGSREKSWGKIKKYSDTKQRVDDLFFEFIRILDGLQPKVFVAENVKGLTIGKAKGYFKQIYQAMEQAGYNVSCRVLDAQYLGVPQHRERAIFIGVRNDLGIKPSHPKPQKMMTTFDVLPKIQKQIIGNNKFKPIWGSIKKPHPTILQGGAHGGSGKCIDENGKERVFTITELKRICSFPDDFKLIGTYAQKWERLGRAVPPLMMKAIAEHIRDNIL